MFVQIDNSVYYSWQLDRLICKMYSMFCPYMFSIENVIKLGTSQKIDPGQHWCQRNCSYCPVMSCSVKSLLDYDLKILKLLLQNSNRYPTVGPVLLLQHPVNE